MSTRKKKAGPEGDLAKLDSTINAKMRRAADVETKLREAYFAIGDDLIKAKAMVQGMGLKWEDHCKKAYKFGMTKCRVCMALARGDLTWEKYQTDQSERWETHKAKEAEEAPAEPEAEEAEEEEGAEDTPEPKQDDCTVEQLREVFDRLAHAFTNKQVLLDDMKAAKRKRMLKLLNELCKLLKEMPGQFSADRVQLH